MVQRAGYAQAVTATHPLIVGVVLDSQDTALVEHSIEERLQTGPDPRWADRHARKRLVHAGELMCEGVLEPFPLSRCKEVTLRYTRRNFALTAPMRRVSGWAPGKAGDSQEYEQRRSLRTNSNGQQGGIVR